MKRKTKPAKGATEQRRYLLGKLYRETKKNVGKPSVSNSDTVSELAPGSTRAVECSVVYLIPVAQAIPEFRADADWEAQTFADEFNRLERINPKGFIAIVDNAGLLAKRGDIAAGRT